MACPKFLYFIAGYNKKVPVFLFIHYILRVFLCLFFGDILFESM